MKKIIMTSAFQLIFLNYCISQKITDISTCWLNNLYIECLKDSLPCQCQEKIRSYYSITLDTNKHSNNYGIALSKFEQMEPYFYSIKKTGIAEFEVLRETEHEMGLAYLKINGDSLFLFYDTLISIFVLVNKSNHFDAQHYKESNVVFINKAFIERGFPKLEEIINNNLLNCDCNKWLENKNILYVKGEPKGWILEIANDSLKIIEIINMERDPDDSLQIKEIASFIWH